MCVFAPEHPSLKTYTRQLSEFLSGGGAVGFLINNRDLTIQEFYSDLKNLKDYGYLNARGDVNPKTIDSLFLFILTNETNPGQFELERLADYRLML